MSDKKLAGEIAVVTGSDSRIGQATAIVFAHEGADLAVTYLEDQQGAYHTRPTNQKTFIVNKIT